MENKTKLVIDTEVSDLIEKTQHLNCNILEIDLDDDLYEAVMITSIKLVGKVLTHQEVSNGKCGENT